MSFLVSSLSLNPATVLSGLGLGGKAYAWLVYWSFMGQSPGLQMFIRFLSGMAK